MKKKRWAIWSMSGFLIGMVQVSAALSLNFANLNSSLTNNTLTVDGSSDGLLVTGVATNNNYLYAVTYTGADFDGDTVNDTLTVDVLVEGFSGGTVNGGTGLGSVANNSTTDASATVGTTDEDVNIANDKWYAGETTMVPGETLKFSVQNITVDTGRVLFDGFNWIVTGEDSGHSHQCVIGLGTGLNGYDYNNALNQAVNPALSPLYISVPADQPGNAWGVSGVGFSLTVTFEVERTVVDWEGTVDRNWNMPGNWSSNQVPGAALNELVILSGSNDMPVVATPVDTTNSYSIHIVDEASLEVCKGELLCDDVFLGSEAGLGGGRMQLLSSADVVVSGDLRVGDSTAATSESSLELIYGALAVDGELTVGNGFLAVQGALPVLDAVDFTVSSNGTLRFEFDTYPVSTINVSNQLTLEEGAKLEIDLSRYTMGGNELELMTFSSVSGSFDPADITITGLAGGVVTLDGDSLNLTVLDDVAKRSSTLWFIAKGGDGSALEDLKVNTGRRIRDLSSPDLSYTEGTEGNDLVYSVDWAGSDFDGDGVNDTVSFDLRVEGFSGSTYSYTASDDSNTSAVASMTALGSPDVISGNSDGWGVGTDTDLDAGETLRFSVENIQLSTPGVGDVGSFVAMRMVEPNGGNNHILMVGEGDDLESWKWSNYLSIGLTPKFPLVVTSAASSKVGVNEVVFKLMVSQRPDIMGSEAGDYSVYPTGPEDLGEYPAVTNVDYPAFSWDTLPMKTGIASGDALSLEKAQIIADTYPLVSLGGNSDYGFATIDEGIHDTAATLKAMNPNVHLSTYRNAGIHFTDFSENENMNTADWFEYTLDADGNRVYDTHSGGQLAYNHDHPELRKWWVDVALDLISDPNIDSLFIDKANGGDVPVVDDQGQFLDASSGKVQSYLDLRERVPAGSSLGGNILRSNRFGGNRELLQIFNGAYLESLDLPSGGGGFSMTAADARVMSIQMMREAGLKGYELTPNFKALKWHKSDNESAEYMVATGRAEEVREIMKQTFQLPLAYHLIMLEPYSYFSYSVGSSEEFTWNTKAYFDEFRNPLGEPLGPPTLNGYVFTRSFEHVEVWLDVEHQTCKLTWDWMPMADSQSIQMDEDTSMNITLTGSDPRETDFTYAVYTPPENGTLSGTAPNLVYTPAPNFAGQDRFTFKTYNDMAESMKATVSISVANTDPDAPEVTTNVVQLADTEWAYQGEVCTGALPPDIASDPDGDPITYSLQSGPAWLILQADGSYSGTPFSADVGLNQWVVRVTDDTGLYVDFTLELQVFDDSVVIAPAGSGSGYDITGTEAEAFRSSDTAKPFDPDGDGAYGTDGWLFFGDNGDANDTGSFTFHTSESPAWVTSIAAGAGFSQVRTGLSYAQFDDPTLSIAPAVSNWIRTGIATTAEGAAGAWGEIATFRMDHLAPGAVRVGIMAGNEDRGDGIYDPTGLRLSFNGGPVSEVGELEITDLGMVFFDITINDDVSGTFSIEGQQREVSKGASIAGITFDIIETDRAENSVPVADRLAVVTDENQGVAVTLTGSDADWDSLAYSIVTSPSNGILSGTAPDLTYTPSVDYHGIDSFSFMASDGLASSVAASVSITVRSDSKPGYPEWMSGYGISGINALATANPDGDAYNNYEEYIAGLNPNVADSLTISNVTLGASNTLEWSAASGRVYNVYWSSNLLSGFSLIESNVVNGSFSDIHHAGAPAGFYKFTVDLE